MDTAMHVLSNMNELGYINNNDNEISGGLVSNDGSVLIEIKRTKSDVHSIWSSTPTDSSYYSSRITITFKDKLTGRVILEIHTNPSMVSALLDSVESWISFNYSYDCICPLEYTDIMGNIYEFSFSLVDCNNKYALPYDTLDSNLYPYRYYLEVLQYSSIEERMIPRLKIELECLTGVDENTVSNSGKCTLYDFCDMLFYVSFFGEDIYDTEWRL